MTKKTVILVTNNGMSNAKAELSHKLIENYLWLLDKENYLPSFICFYGEGVKLIAEGSHVVEQLRNLEKRGVSIVACKTCLLSLELLDRVQLGNVGTMHDIIDIQWKADKVITL